MTQTQALAVLKTGRNVFLTGPAGSGKTYVLNQYIAHLKKSDVGIGITASTGIAATHIGGYTIHSWSGLGIKEQLTDDYLASLIIRPHLRNRFQKTDVLIIDEISMLHHWQLDLVDRICRNFRQLDQPFGGLQLILCGDFFQLPPVAKPGQTSQFATTAQSWQSANIQVCYLEEQHRQTDSSLSSVLNAIRQNEVDETTFEELKQRYQQPVEGISTPTKLFTHNADVDTINQLQLNLIKEEPHVFDMRAFGNPALIEPLRKGCLAPQRLILKPGAVVMFVKNNFEAGYVNGTIGTVLGFDEDGNPIIETRDGRLITAQQESWKIEEEDKTKAELNQIPLRLAWAITIHKSQGMSLDAAEIDLAKTFIPGQGYVALSRVRTLDGLSLKGFNNLALRVHDQALELDQQLKKQSDETEIWLDNVNQAKTMTI